MDDYPTFVVGKGYSSFTLTTLIILINSDKTIRKCCNSSPGNSLFYFCKEKTCIAIVLAKLNKGFERSTDFTLLFLIKAKINEKSSD